MPTDRFCYWPLDHREIRLLRINHGFLHCYNCPNGSVSWGFDRVHLDWKTPYLAISYAWGGAPTKQFPQVGGDASIPVTENALKVLQHLLSEYEPPFNVWIDALCINQDDDAEKRSQLPLMRDIYQNAVQVIAWLGGDMRCIDAEDAFKAIDMVNSYAKDSYRQPGALRLNPSTPWAYSLLLKPLLQCTWFSRIWIFQELVKGSCVLLVFKDSLGRIKELLWDNLYLFLLDYNMINFTPELKQPMRTYASSNACIMAGHRHLHGLDGPDSLGGGSGISLQTLLMEVAPYFHATDPRDKIYALMGLSSDIHFEDLDLAYTTPVESVFTQAAELILASGKSKSSSPLALLSFAGIGNTRTLKNLPTWVPDWATAARRMSFGIGTLTTEGTYFGAVAERAGYDSAAGASYTLPVVYSAFSRPRTLALKGVLLDQVQDVGSRYPLGVTPGESSYVQDQQIETREWLKQAWQLVTSVMPYITNESADVLLSRTLIGDLRQDFKPWSSTHGRTCGVGVFETCHNAFFRCITDTIQGQSQRRQLIEKARYFVAAFERHGADRVLFTTECGYLGLGSEGIQVGDYVALLYGAKVPFLLRRVKWSDSGLLTQECTEFQLVSECYVRGIMHGEGLQYGVEQDIVLV
ncbi:hypothetical protein FOXB_07883 [Fusarium oxysporum f. sp. conglutinans Fo5176]|uniref:Heterokaryon incompatibility domain-containing protein n=1 Tax=Fusarium oxysporum (strain Fo5176) TaxID=660025 RepID=F9FNA3_FUSOF|nr:hypothetical protein FOXB_07883 [Fusarium oxysporum f. sp. conglutinans Fo5176]